MSHKITCVTCKREPADDQDLVRWVRVVGEIGQDYGWGCPSCFCVHQTVRVTQSPGQVGAYTPEFLKSVVKSCEEAAMHFAAMDRMPIAEHLGFAAMVVRLQMDGDAGS